MGAKIRRHFKPSTRQFYLEGKTVPNYSFFDFLHGYVYLRWTYFYISIATGEHPALRWLKPLVRAISRKIESRAQNDVSNMDINFHSKDIKQNITIADTYHGKVVPPVLAEQLVTMDQEIDLRNLENIIPYATAKDIILKNPDHIAVLDCPCRSSRSNPCLPLDVCLVIGDPFASVVVEHHPQRARWISQDEAVEILNQEHQRGHVHHAFFKDAMLGRFYAICNCCTCCCGAMQAHNNHVPMLASSGYISKFDATHCNDCGTCLQSCPFGAIGKKATLIEIDAEICMGCGVCVSHCKNTALSLHRDVKKSEPLDIHQLLSVVP